MTTTSGRLIGVGYEGLDLDQFVMRLRLREVDIVADVRLTPISRKRGFAKRALSERLAAEGIEYRHLRALGNPKENRAGFAAEGADGLESRRRYASLLEADGANACLQELVDVSATKTVALLCFEADESRCHRSVVLDALRRRSLSYA
ncbi:DUF488 domain-containing protein [Curtobacterium sp. Leaf261]|uniref:DUF488 domain-containing protein n=1 Tax=Curtobacterium sp. Leaf261 TaxID=1736311 RepID=UPI0006F627E0|nr:DUF488 domain-containing protein [Curtobacterium sp. Leaf261]KQO63732.1 hypothetical protein ASF23_05805 [Curtobacterium sp. Leaf261]